MQDFFKDAFLNHDYITDVWPDLTLPMLPGYNEAKFGNWEVVNSPVPLARGYFTGYSSGQGNVSLVNRADNTVWMSLTPMELDSHIIPNRDAFGDVVVVGLGMGMIVLNMMHNPNVSSITVLEKEPDIIAAFPDILEGYSKQIWEDAIEDGSLKVVCCDATDINTLPNIPCDFLYVDFWSTLADDTAVAKTKYLADHFNPQEVAHWGQEMDFVCAMKELGISREQGICKETMQRITDHWGFTPSVAKYDEESLALYDKMVFIAAMNVANY